MKGKYVLAGLIALSMVAFAFVAPVAATEFFPTLMNDRKGKIFTWHFDTYDSTNGPFNGSLVDATTIVAKWWDAEGNTYTVTPYDIVLAETYVELYFYKQNLPKSAYGNSVAGSLTNGDTFFASGPGWTWSNGR